MSDNSEYDNVHTYGPGCIENHPRSPDSAKKHQSFQENMKRLYGEIERMVYAAEIACPNVGAGRCPAAGGKTTMDKKQLCPFREIHPEWWCGLPALREVLGDHVEQHNIELSGNTRQLDESRECPR